MNSIIMNARSLNIVNKFERIALQQIYAALQTLKLARNHD